MTNEITRPITEFLERVIIALGINASVSTEETSAGPRLNVTGEPILRWPCGSAVTAVAIASDIGVAATATVHGEVALWDLVTGEPRARLSGHPAVRALALNPAADRLLVGGDTLAVYALAADDTPRLLARLHTAQPVTAVAVNPAMPLYAVFGGALGQVGYVRLPVDR